MEGLFLLAVALAFAVRTAYAGPASQFVTSDSPVPADGIRVTTLGSGCPDVRKNQVASGFVIELGNGDKFVWDFGSGAYVNLVATGIPQAQLTKVFLTHLHSDHMGDLPSFYVGHLFGRKDPWELWGPSSEAPELGAAAMVDGLNKLMAWDKFARRRIDYVGKEDRGDEVIAHEFDATKKKNLIYDRNGVKIWSTPVEHYNTVGPVAYRLEWNGLSVVYSGDMRPNQNFEDLAQDTDLLLFQNMGPIKNGDIASLPYSSQYLINTSHVIPEQTGPILSRLNPRLTVLHHLIVNDATREHVITAVRKHYPEGELHINEDLDVFEITKSEITRKKFLVPGGSWGFWHAESNWHSEDRLPQRAEMDPQTRTAAQRRRRRRSL